MPGFLRTFVVAVAALIAAPAAAQDLWTATLTVGTLAGGRHRTVGYVNLRDLDPAGSLSDTEFSVGAEHYTVVAMYVLTHADTGRESLVVGLDPPFTGDRLAFTADAATFVVADAYIHRQFAEGGHDFIIWDAPDLDWVDGQRVSVGLIGPESVPALPAPALGLLAALLAGAGFAARPRAR